MVMAARQPARRPRYRFACSLLRDQLYCDTDDGRLVLGAATVRRRCCVCDPRAVGTVTRTKSAGTGGAIVS